MANSLWVVKMNERNVFDQQWFPDRRHYFQLRNGMVYGATGTSQDNQAYPVILQSVSVMCKKLFRTVMGNIRHL